MTLDRSKPPPHCEVVAYPPEDVPGAVKRMYCVGCTTARGGQAMAYAECAETEAEAISRAWDNYDWITLPARVDLLRDLAAELEAGRGELFDACVDRGTPNDVACTLHDMANALEAGGQTAKPTPTR